MSTSTFTPAIDEVQQQQQQQEETIAVPRGHGVSPDSRCRRAVAMTTSIAVGHN
jgi:hypothetical protein